MFSYGNGNEIYAATVGEVIAAAEFNDYDAKYNNEDSKTIISAEIPQEKIEEIRKRSHKGI